MIDGSAQIRIDRVCAGKDIRTPPFGSSAGGATTRDKIGETVIVRTGSWIGVSLLFLAASAAAQEAQPPLHVVPPQPEPAQAAGDQSRSAYIPPLSDRPLDISEGDKIATTGFRVRGVTHHPELGVGPFTAQRLVDGLYQLIASGETLSVQAALDRAGERRAPPVTGLTVGQMQLVAAQLAQYLRDSGLVLAQAYVPVQTVSSDGVVAIEVLEGKLGKVVVEGSKRMPAALIAASANSLHGDALTRQNIESALLTAQNLPGTAVQGTFRPGANTGETDLVLKVQNEERFEFRFGGDNYGTDFAGETRARVDALIHNPSGFGDQIALTAVQAFDPENTTYGSLRYSLSPGSPQVRVHLLAERAAFVAENKSAATLDVDGDNQTYEAGLRWEFRRTRELTVGTTFALQSRVAKVEFDKLNFQLTDDKLRVAVLDLSGQRFDTRFKGVDFFNLTLHKGEDRADGPEIILNDERFWLTRFGYSRYQRLTDHQSLLLLTRGQYSEDTLSALERFSLGGPDSVRAFPVSEILTDRGVLASLEYRVGAPGFANRASPFRGAPWGKVVQVLLFGDYAWGKLAENDPGDEIYGAGGGLLLNAGPVNAKLTVATPLSSIEPSDDDDVRLYSEFAVSF